MIEEFKSSRKHSMSVCRPKPSPQRMHRRCACRMIEESKSSKSSPHVCMQAEAFTPEDAQTLRLPDAQERAQLQDPLARLENGERDKAVARGEAVRMSHLRELNNERYKDDYAANKALRRRLRCVPPW